VDSGAFKDLDLKQIDLEGVNLEMGENTPAPVAEAAPEAAPHEEEPPAGETPEQ